MINLSQLLFPDPAYSRDRENGHGTPGFRRSPRGPGGPAVVWEAPGELSAAECRGVVDDLVSFQVPVLMLAGADPEARPEILDLASYAAGKGLRISFVLAGAPLSEGTAVRMKEMGVTYVSVSVEGPRAVHDGLRGPGSYDGVVATIRRCHAAGLKVSLGFALVRGTEALLPGIFELVDLEGLDRLAVYHRVYATAAAAALDATPEECRRVIDSLMAKAIDMRVAGRRLELLTVDNYADAIYAYLKTRVGDADRAARMWQLLAYTRGNQAGVNVGAIDARGFVLADLGTPQHPFGNVRNQPFSQIWSGCADPYHAGLRNRQMLLKGRCAACRWLSVCNGNSRSRAEAVTGDFWESDPQCYLTDSEIGLESQ